MVSVAGSSLKSGPPMSLKQTVFEDVEASCGHKFVRI